MRVALRALPRPTISSTKPRQAGRSSKSGEARSNRASPSALLRWPCALSIEPFSCDTPGLLRVGVMRIASPEMLLNINLLPHLICSFWASGGIGGYEAGEHDDTGRRPSRTRGNDSCARGERPHAPLGNQARKAAP